MCLQTAPIYYIKYRNEESEHKALRKLINEERVVEVTTIEEGRTNMRSVTTVKIKVYLRKL